MRRWKRRAPASRARLCGGGQRSACTGAALGTAAKEIKELIDASIQKVQAGTQLTNSAADHESGDRIGGRVTKVMGEISNSTREQSEGSARSIRP
jgi:hypothetical protein